MNIKNPDLFFRWLEDNGPPLFVFLVIWGVAVGSLIEWLVEAIK